MTPQKYFWVVGLRGNGQQVFDGPHHDRESAEDIASDLTKPEIFELPTRNHSRAKQLIAGRGGFEQERRSSLHTDEPPEQEERVIDRIMSMFPRNMGGKKRDEDEDLD